MVTARGWAPALAASPPATTSRPRRAEPGALGEPPGKRPAEALARDRGERLVRALEDALGADVDPRPRGHLAVHEQARGVERAELLPGRPLRHEVRVGDQHARRLLVRLEDRDRLARLDEQRLALAERRELALDRREARLVARGLADPAVDDEVLRALGDVGMQVVLEHPQRRLLLPAAAAKVGHAARRYRSVPVTLSAAARIRPARTSSAAASMSGARNRSGPGPPTRRRSSAITAAVARAGSRCWRSWIPRLAVSSSIARTHASASTARRSLRAADHPIETWSSCMAELGIESTDAGTARRLSSDTSPACVYWAIMYPESTPGSWARNAGSPWLRAGSRKRSVRRSEMLARLAATIARKSRTYPSGAPWKLPLDSTRPSGVTTGLSIAAASSRSATAAAWSTVSRAPPATAGAQRSE